MNMIFCHGCGKEIHETATACPNCGAVQASSDQKPSLGGNSFQKFYLDVVLNKYTLHKGRSNRQEFWMFYLYSAIVSIAVYIVGAIIGGHKAGDAFQSLYSLAVMLPSINISTRRLHDIGRSGWWILLPIVNIVFWCTNSQADDNEYGASK